MKIAVCLFFIMLVFFHIAGAVDFITTDPEPDTSYLPYYFTDILNWKRSPSAKSVHNTAKVFEPAIISKIDSALFVRAYNQELSEKRIAIFDLMQGLSRSTTDSDPAPGFVSDWDYYFDKIENRKQVITAVYWKDSIFAYKLNPPDDYGEKLFLKRYPEGSFGTEYGPRMSAALIEDYDYDGITEAFIYVWDEHSTAERVLFCIELEEFRVEWSIPIPSGVPRAYSTRDSANPGIIFSTYNPKHGVYSDEMSDMYCYLGIVNNKGKITFIRKTSLEHGISDLIPGINENEYFVYHQYPLVGQIDTLQGDNGTYFLSKIDRSARVVKTIAVDESPEDIFIAEYDGNPCLFLNLNFRSMNIYDFDLTQVAQTGKLPEMDDFRGTIKLPGQSDDAFVFRRHIYTPDFKLLACLPDEMSSFDVLTFDSAGNANTLLINLDENYSITRISRRSFRQLANIYYINNRNYIVILIAVLLILVIIIFFSRQKARKELVIQRLQKETEIAEAKYHQVKEIAGTFAHEIRNALFPSVATLDKLKEKDEIAPERRKEYFIHLSNSVARAISLTKKINQYTRLEQNQEPGPVNLQDVVEKVIKDNSQRISEMKVEIQSDISENIKVLANPEHLEIVFNNLLINALDALTKASNPHIIISVKKGEGFVHVSFRDNGIGIPKEKQKRIFDNFFTTKPTVGTGIGLAITKRIVEMYGGEISVESEPSRGTVFILQLKRAL